MRQHESRPVINDLSFEDRHNETKGAPHSADAMYDSLASLPSSYHSPSQSLKPPCHVSNKAIEVSKCLGISGNGGTLAYNLHLPVRKEITQFPVDPGVASRESKRGGEGGLFPGSAGELGVNCRARRLCITGNIGTWAKSLPLERDGTAWRRTGPRHLNQGA